VAQTRRFSDPNARFKFVPAKGYRPEPEELRFDMYKGEFTHEGWLPRPRKATKHRSPVACEAMHHAGSEPGKR